MNRAAQVVIVLVALVQLAGCASKPQAPAPVQERRVSSTAGNYRVAPPAPRSAPPAGAGDREPAARVAPLPADAPVRAQPLPEETLAAAPPEAMPAAPSSTQTNPAVASLLESAASDHAEGRYDRAAASLERALQIEPRNAWIWHRLAVTRLAQGQREQARNLASKSNSLAPEDRMLQSENGKVIASAARR